MKRYNNLYKKITSFENILDATRKARKGKRFKQSTALFELELEKNIFKIMEVLKNKTYEPGAYRDFYIYEPKKRLISAAPYYDRVVHHALINIIEPVIGKSFIHDSYACIKGKGTHKAVKRYRQFCKQNRYVLKCDIVKYFPHIDQDILLDQVKGYIKCKDTLWLIQKILESKESDCIDYFPEDDLFTPLSMKTGIPIGNLTSQFLANVYLNGFDHYIKEVLKTRYYIRYCDDFVIFSQSKKHLMYIKQKIAEYLLTLRLRLHPHKSRIFRIADGVDFLGYRIYPGYMKVRKSIVKRYRKKLRNMVKMYAKGMITLEKVRCSICSWIGHVKHANSYRLRTEIFSRAVFRRAEK
jgi:RNA-directed DNA polymerase